MKKLLKWLGIILGAVVLIVAVLVIYLLNASPTVDPPIDKTIEATEARLERGKYLAWHVTGCIDCHSTRDWLKFSGPVVAGTEGKGGQVFDSKIMKDFPATLHSPNITPASLKSWSDGEFLRAITCGVSKDGERVYFPMMPYPALNKATEEDVYSIIAYIRSLSPIENTVPVSTINFPLNVILKLTVPQQFDPQPAPDKNNPKEYGKYLTALCGCIECHSPSEKGELIKGKEYGGGTEFIFPGGIVRTANISPDENTGIGKWTKEQFVARFKSFSPDSSEMRSVSEDEFNTPMAWSLLSGMNTEDLEAIYEYLRTQPAVNNKVIHWEPNK